MIPHLHPHAGDCEHACCLKIEHLSVHIGGETILDNIDLHMHCGQMVALIGPNGAGKSTLIRAILGQREYEGKITFHEASGKEAKLRIGYVPQSPAFDRGDPVSVMDLFTCCIFKRPAFLRPTKAMREKFWPALRTCTAKRSSTSASAHFRAASCSACCWRWRLSPCRIFSYSTSRSPAWMSRA